MKDPGPNRLDGRPRRTDRLLDRLVKIELPHPAPGSERPFLEGVGHVVKLSPVIDVLPVELVVCPCNASLSRHYLVCPDLEGQLQ